MIKNKSKLVFFLVLYACGIDLAGGLFGNKFYMVTEHPKILFYDLKYIRYANFSSARFGRQDFMYYVGLHVDLVYPFGNNITFNFYIYELLTNVYKRSFVEMHWTCCDFFEKDKFFGAAMKQGKILDSGCPIPAGKYHFYNMTVPVEVIPPNFPFTKGRIYANLTATETGALISAGYIDMELKPYKRKKKLKVINSWHPGVYIYETGEKISLIQMKSLEMSLISFPLFCLSLVLEITANVGFHM